MEQWKRALPQAPFLLHLVMRSLLEIYACLLFSFIRSLASQGARSHHLLPLLWDRVKPGLTLMPGKQAKSFGMELMENNFVSRTPLRGFVASRPYDYTLEFKAEWREEPGKAGASTKAEAPRSRGIYPQWTSLFNKPLKQSLHKAIYLSSLTNTFLYVFRSP